MSTPIIGEIDLTVKMYPKVRYINCEEGILIIPLEKRDKNNIVYIERLERAGEKLSSIYT